MRTAILAACLLVLSALSASAYKYQEYSEWPHNAFGPTASYGSGQLFAGDGTQMLSLALNIGSSCIGGGAGCAIGIVQSLLSYASEQQGRGYERSSPRQHYAARRAAPSEKQIAAISREAFERGYAQAKVEFWRELELKYEMKPRVQSQEMPKEADPQKKEPPNPAPATKKSEASLVKPALFWQFVPEPAPAIISASLDDSPPPSRLGAFGAGARRMLKTSGREQLTASMAGISTANLNNIILAMRE